MTQPIGMPPPIDFAHVERSGTMPACSYAAQRPVRQKPDCTSSQMSKNAVLVADLAKAPQILGRRGDEASLALDDLDEDRGDVLGGDGPRHEALAETAQLLLDEGLHRHAVPVLEIVREGKAVDLRSKRAAVLLVGALGREAHAEERASVERAVIGEDGGSARRLSRDLDRVLDGLGARVDEHDFRRIAVRQELDELLAKSDVGLVRTDVDAGVKELRRLLLNRFHDRFVAVTGVDDADAAREVDPLAAVQILEPRAFGGRHRRLAREHPDPARHDGVSPANQILSLAHDHLPTEAVRFFPFFCLVFTSRSYLKRGDSAGGGSSVHNVG